ncbi:hypothetical protein ACIF85_47385 [Streptomyces sp. NPDC086033]|uniref:effector-associated constant component EACC1 n=1 Tax=Streptomyces sp. NPDC086033 TaxID=3365747 RepID=UPI0037D95102
MDVRIRIECADAAEGNAAELTEAFADWLGEDRAVAAYADIRKVRRSRNDGGMSGDVLGWIAFGTSSGFSAAALAYSHLSYRASLPRRVQAVTRMVIERGSTRVTIEGGSADDVSRITQALGAAEPAGPAPSAGPSA